MDTLDDFVANFELFDDWDSRYAYIIELGEHGVDHHPDPADWMIGWDQILGTQRRQHRQLAIRASTHTPILFHPNPKREHQLNVFRFSAPC